MTFLIRLTPYGKGAVASLLLTGKTATRFINHKILPKLSEYCDESAEKKPHFAKFAIRHGTETVHEEVVVFQKTPEHVEIHCHGGETVISAIEKELAGLGAEKQNSLQYLPASFPQDAVQTAALEQLLRAETEFASKILLSQYNGALSEEIRSIQNIIQKGKLREGQQRLEHLAESSQLHLITPFKVALTGGVNVGKSRLLNRISGWERSIVTPVPGTTRDLVSCKTAIGGFPVLLIDTAGIRPTDDAVELLGVGQSQAILQDIDLVLNVLDAANPSPDSMQLTHFNNSALSVYNKIDLLDDIDIMDLPCRDHVYCVSAETGRGINDLLEGILTELVPNPPQVGKPVLFMPEQVNALQKAKDLLEKGEISASLRQLEQILNGENP